MMLLEVGVSSILEEGVEGAHSFETIQLVLLKAREFISPVIYETINNGVDCGRNGRNLRQTNHIVLEPVTTILNRYCMQYLHHCEVHYA